MNSRPTLRKAWIPLLGAIVLCTLSGPPAAYGQRRGRNPFDARVQGFVRDAERAGPSPAAILPILRLSNEWVDASPGLVRRQLERLASSRRLSPPMRVHAAVLAAIQRARQGEVLEADRELDALGFVRDVHVIGGFDNEGRQGYGRLLPPEQLQDRIVDDAIEYPGRERPIHWRPYPDIIRRGYVDLDAILRPNVNVCGFVETFVRVERARPLTIWLGGGGANKLYFNGALVLDDPVYRSPDIDRAVALVGARPGWNRVLVKSCVTDMAWGVYLRLGEADGSPAQGLELASRPRGPLAPAPAEPPRLGASPQAPLAFFEAAVREHPEDAGALFDLARFLRWTGAEDVTEGRARQLAQRAAELEPNVERLLFAAALAETRAERMRYSEQAKALAPRDPRVLLYDAGLVALGPDPDRALRLVQQIPDGSVEGVAGRRLEAALLSSLGLPRAAGSRLHAAAAASAGSLRALHLEHQVQSSLGHVQAAHEQLERIVEAQPDDVSARRGLLDDALERGESDRVEAQLQAMLEIAPGDAGTLYYVASIYDAMGREDDSLELIRRVAELIPDEADVHVQLGNAYLRYGREDAAAASLRRALVLRPQDAATRQRLERLRPAVRADEAYATSIEEILTRRGEGDGWSATILHDLTVNTVFENGLGSSFHQIAFQVHDEEGARRRDHYSVRYEPGAQWVDLRSAKIHRADGTIVEAVRTFVQPLAAAGYRIYYDASALVISLPDLEPGDTVEIRYRLEDVSRRNAFNDYYGDLHFLQGFDPSVRHEYVLISPRSRQLYFNEPTLQGLRREHRELDDQNIDHFVAENIPAIRRERNMPGLTELAPYLHVSTYQSWEEVGRWWWGLAAEQLHMDEDLVRTTRELVAGAPDTLTKVRRIYAWVIRNTRYVGLEFGIHGFKPYRITQVVQRGFGDCKDKASLLYAMLTEAGVDARIALVRTRDNGAVPESPASLAVFNHAIAYVPELDLYLDGTAETSGAEELPAGDQGIRALVVGPETAEMRPTPTHPASAQGRDRELRITLAADGSARVEGSETVRGVYAASYRSRYQALESRDERLQRELSGIFPGVELSSQSFGDLEDFDREITYRYEASVPQMAQRAGGDLRMPPSTLSGLLSGWAPSPSRLHPLELGPRTRFVERRTLRLAQGLSVGHLPESAEARSSFGRLQMRYERVGRELRISTELELNRDRVSVADYPAFRAWVEAADALLRERVTLGGAR